MNTRITGHLHRRPDPAVAFIIDTVAAATGAPAFVAGGFLRDRDHGVEPKDIDVFLTYTDSALAAVRYAFRHWRPFQMIPKNYVDGMNGVEAVLGYELPGFAWPINIIFLSKEATMETVLSRFDFGLCQIGTDGVAVYTTDAYDTDKDSRTFTLVSDHSPPRSLRRFERFQEKYPGYKLVGLDRSETVFQAELEELSFA